MQSKIVYSNELGRLCKSYLHNSSRWWCWLLDESNSCYITRMHTHVCTCIGMKLKWTKFKKEIYFWKSNHRHVSSHFTLTFKWLTICDANRWSVWRSVLHKCTVWKFLLDLLNAGPPVFPTCQITATNRQTNLACQ